MRYDLHPEALEEFECSADFYAKRRPGLELRFIDAVEKAICSACEVPQKWRIVEGELRRVLVHGFPYAVLYAIEPDRIFIIAITHCARRPGYWRERISR